MLSDEFRLCQFRCQSSVLSCGVKWPGRDSDYISPSNAELVMRGAVPALPHASAWHGAYSGTSDDFSSTLSFETNTNISEKVLTLH